MSESNSTDSPERTSKASLTRLEIRMYIRLIDTWSRNSDGLRIDTIRISFSLSISISIPRVSRKNARTSARVFLFIGDEHVSLMTSAPAMYPPIMRSIKPSPIAQQSSSICRFVKLSCSGERRKSPEANSSILTRSPLPRLLALIHSFGRETITVEPPVNCNLRKAPRCSN